MTYSDPCENKDIARSAEAEVNPIFIRRWSPRSFRSEPIPEHVVNSVMEAARWSPSCFNEQPWLFLVATSEDERKRFCQLLKEGNQAWAHTAPMLGFILTKRRFDKTGKENEWAQFDAGAAWMALTMQARMWGLYTHGMAGVEYDKAYEELKIPREEYKLICAFAMGPKGIADQLPESLREKEKPNQRNPLHKVWKFGSFS